MSGLCLIIVAALLSIGFVLQLCFGFGCYFPSKPYAQGTWGWSDEEYDARRAEYMARHGRSE